MGVAKVVGLVKGIGSGQSRVAKVRCGKSPRSFVLWDGSKKVTG